MEITPSVAEITSLFANGNPSEVWKNVYEIIRYISPAYDTSHAKSAFDDVMRLFSGDYPGYCPIGTLYHDRQHTLDVFLCAIRLMHGVHVSGYRVTDDEISMIMIASLMHDTGYAQPVGENSGTGAQHTKIHVNRSVAFMQQYFAENNLPAAWVEPLKHIILCSNPALKISEIEFVDERTRRLGEILGTADMTGQMADRNYLEKLLFLFLEFEEASYGNYQNIHDLLRNTQVFYEASLQRLRVDFGGIYNRFSCHFKCWYGVNKNYYLESIENNISYLAKITALDDGSHLDMLKRDGIVERQMAIKNKNRI